MPGITPWATGRLSAGSGLDDERRLDSPGSGRRSRFLPPAAGGNMRRWRDRSIVPGNVKYSVPDQYVSPRPLRMPTSCSVALRGKEEFPCSHRDALCTSSGLRRSLPICPRAQRSEMRSVLSARRPFLFRSSGRIDEKQGRTRHRSEAEAAPIFVAIRKGGTIGGRAVGKSRRGPGAGCAAGRLGASREARDAFVVVNSRLSGREQWRRCRAGRSRWR